MIYAARFFLYHNPSGETRCRQVACAGLLEYNPDTNLDNHG